MTASASPVESGTRAALQSHFEGVLYTLECIGMNLCAALGSVRSCERWIHGAEAMPKEARWLANPLGNPEQQVLTLAGTQLGHHDAHHTWGITQSLAPSN